MTSMPARLLAEINLNAIAKNWQVLNQASGVGMAGAVVKADAYGHGMEAVATALKDAGCDLFFTASLEEAVALRQTLPDAKIGYFDCFGHDHELLVIEYNLTPTIADFTSLSLLADSAARYHRLIPAMLHFDSGMNRLGFNLGDLKDVIAHRGFEAGDWHMVYSHLACADDPDDPMNIRQLQDFKSIIAHPRLNNIKTSLSATGGIMLGADYHFDITRPGLGVYGLKPDGSSHEDLTPALTLKARTLQIRSAAKGETVGYGGAVKLNRDSVLATIAGGYADGINRKLSGDDGRGGRIHFNGHTAPMIGRVSMDMHVVDITDLPEGHLNVDDMVTLIGDGFSIQDWAEKSDTIAYEMLTTLGLRAKRHYDE